MSREGQTIEASEHIGAGRALLQCFTLRQLGKRPLRTGTRQPEQKSAEDAPLVLWGAGPGGSAPSWWRTEAVQSGRHGHQQAGNRCELQAHCSPTLMGDASWGLQQPTKCPQQSEPNFPQRRPVQGSAPSPGRTVAMRPGPSQSSVGPEIGGPAGCPKASSPLDPSTAHLLSP